MQVTSKRCPFHCHTCFVTGFAKVSRAKFIYQKLPSHMPRQLCERTIIVICLLANQLQIPIDTKMLQVRFFLQTATRKLRRYHQHLSDQRSLYFFLILFKCPDSLPGFLEKLHRPPLDIGVAFRDICSQKFLMVLFFCSSACKIWPA